MYCDNCRNCYDCLSDHDLKRKYDEVMSISVYNRIKYGCNCYMCNDYDSCTCIELTLFYKQGGGYNQEVINDEIEKIKKQIKYDNRRLFRRYILCVIKVRQLYNNVIENNFTPPYGKGYLDSKIHFEKNIKID